MWGIPRVLHLLVRLLLKLVIGMLQKLFFCCAVSRVDVNSVAMWLMTFILRWQVILSLH